MIPILWLSGKKKLTKKIKESVVAKDWKEGGMNRQSPEGFYGCETTLCVTIMIDRYVRYVTIMSL